MTTTALSSSMKQTAEPVISRRQPAPAIYALAQYSVEQRADRSWPKADMLSGLNSAPESAAASQSAYDIAEV